METATKKKYSPSGVDGDLARCHVEWEFELESCYHALMGTNVSDRSNLVSRNLLVPTKMATEIGQNGADVRIVFRPGPGPANNPTCVASRRNQRLDNA